MAIAFTDEVLLHGFNTFSVGITVNPVKSQPGQPAYASRGIFDTRPLDIMAEDGSVFSDQQTILDIREKEFTVLPAQGDFVNIPVDCNSQPLGDYEVLDADTNGGGETTLVLRKLVNDKP